MLSDILPTGYECGVLNGCVKPGAVVAIVGAGPVGLAALLTSKFFTPSRIIAIDVDDHRLGVAKSFGATDTVNSSDGKAVEKVLALTGRVGVDVAMGIPATFGICQEIIAPGGPIANIGVHGSGVNPRLDVLWSKNITITRLVDAVTTSQLMESVMSGAIEPQQLITHTFQLDEIEKAYDTFGHAGREHALEVIMSSTATGTATGG